MKVVLGDQQRFIMLIEIFHHQLANGGLYRDKRVYRNLKGLFAI
jgi:hypothetical protein